jgi:hypothetical protein
MFGTSSVAASNWNNRAIFNTNEPELHTSELEVRNRFLVNVTRDFKLIGGNRTTIGLLYDGHTGYPFSFVTTGDINGDGVSGNDLAYIPNRSGDPMVRFATTADSDNFFKIVDRFGLKEGRAVQADSTRYPFVNTFDLSIKQEVKLPGWKHKLVLGADILNIGNMINSKWGVIRGSGQFFRKTESVGTVNYDAVSQQYVISRVNTNLATGTFAPSLGRGEPAATRWSVLLSARYEF